MPIPATDLISRAATILQDEDHARWTVPELLEWINDAAREIILRRPGARSVTKVVELAAGSLQEVASPGVQLLDIACNVATDGVSHTKAVHRVDRVLLDSQMPEWRTERKRAQIRNFTYDDRAPKTFYVYPPAQAGAKVLAMVAELPPTITEKVEAIDMAPEFLNAMVNYMVYRAFSKDSEYAQAQIATLQYQAFMDAVMGPGNAAVANAPKVVA